MKQILIVLVLIGAGVGVYKLMAPPEQAPELLFESAAGETVGWTELREGKRHLLAVFLLPNCTMSDYSAKLVSGLHEQYEESIAFVGLAFGDARVADKYKQDHQLGFTVVGLRAITDPYAAQEFFDVVRGAYGGRAGIYGGTIVLLDTENQMLFGLSQGDVRELPDRLAEL